MASSGDPQSLVTDGINGAGVRIRQPADIGDTIPRGPLFSISEQACKFTVGNNWARRGEALQIAPERLC
jgi:hypothetical protein